MSNDNLKTWNMVKQPKQDVLKKIDFGYLKGKTDINPQWRLMAMTQAFGLVGHGWTYRITRTWSEKGLDGQMMAFAEVAVKTEYEGEWGEEFYGIGGSMIAELSKGVVKSNDEGYKMAVTDALSVAFKAVGVGVIGSKYPTSMNGKKMREYSLWLSILDRVYSKSERKSLSTYNGCEVSENFKSYEYFYEWCNNQVGFNSQDLKETLDWCYDNSNIKLMYY